MMLEPPRDGDEDVSDRPPQEAYGRVIDPEAYDRVTDPERYRPLHHAADALLDQLAADYVVDRTDTVEDLDEDVERVVALSRSAGAPLVVHFTTFPGIDVRYGRWYRESYPRCGCDACDEDPEDLIEDFESSVESLVGGEFWEEVTRSGEAGWLRSSFGDFMSGSRIEPGNPALADPRRLEWPAWVKHGEGRPSP
jgi:hypothetical protein